MSLTSNPTRWRVVASAAVLVIAACAWLLGNHLPTTQPVSVAFRPVGGSAEVEFLPQPWASSPICSCNGGWRGIGLPADQFELAIGNGNEPWSLMVGPMDHTVPANWWFNPSDEWLSTFSLTVTHDGRQIEKIDAPAGITIESSGSPVHVFTPKSSFSAVMPSEGSTTALASEPFPADGEDAGMSSIKLKTLATPASSSDYTSEGKYAGALAGEDVDVDGANFRATMIDTLGPRIDIALGDPANAEETAGTYRLWVGDREVELPQTGDVEVSIRTDFAIRLRPLPFDHSQVVGDPETSNDLVLPQVTQAIPAHEVTLTNAFVSAGDGWDSFLKRADSLGPPVELPDTPSLFVYGDLSRVKTSAVQGTVSSKNGAEVSPGDVLELTSRAGFDFTAEPLLLTAATTEPISDSQYLHGRAIGTLKRSAGSSGIDGLIDRLRGDSLTRTQWLVSIVPFVAAFAGGFTISEVVGAKSSKGTHGSGVKDSRSLGRNSPSRKSNGGGSTARKKPQDRNQRQKK